MITFPGLESGPPEAEGGPGVLNGVLTDDGVVGRLRLVLLDDKPLPVALANAAASCPGVILC